MIKSQYVSEEKDAIIVRYTIGPFLFLRDRNTYNNEAYATMHIAKLFYISIRTKSLWDGRMMRIAYVGKSSLTFKW